jgi:hypothetical protein
VRCGEVVRCGVVWLVISYCSVSPVLQFSQRLGISFHLASPHVMTRKLYTYYRMDRCSDCCSGYGTGSNTQ